MQLVRLSLTDFRNHSDSVLTPDGPIVVLSGENGSGKTNVLEALSLLAPGRGLRGARLSDMARSQGAGGFAVAARLDDVDLGTGTQPPDIDRRLVRINGAPSSATALGEWLAVVWLTPMMDRLFTDGPSERRRFLDRLVLAVDPAHARRSTRFDAAMRQRNRLLADMTPDDAWLSALEAQMAQEAVAIFAARERLVSALSQAIRNEPETQFAKASLSLNGWSPPRDYAGALASARSHDAAAGRTLEGPHRMDLDVIHLAKGQPAARASTGEQKAMLIGLVLSHVALVSAQRTARPLLLLDEVAAHLDPIRRASLYDRLVSSGSQVWMTGTEPALFDALGNHAVRYRVAAGAVIRA